jgi:hypothetical protein
MAASLAALVRLCSGPALAKLARGAKDEEHTMSPKLSAGIAVIGIDIGKNSFHVGGLDRRGAIVLRQKWSRGQVETRLANLPPCLIGMEACVGAHHLSIAWPRRSVDASQICAALLEGAEERLPRRRKVLLTARGACLQRCACTAVTTGVCRKAYGAQMDYDSR